MSTKNFEIGQVVYILSEQAQTILPGLVVEECVVKKITGNSTSWKIKVGHGDKAKLFDSAKINGELHGSLSEVQTVMTKRLQDYIINLVKEAEDRVEKWYGKEIADSQKASFEAASLSSNPEDKIDPDVLLSSIEDSAPAPKFVAEKKQEPKPQTKDGLKDHLKRMAIPDDEPVSENGSVFYVDIDGQRMPVRMPQS